MPLMAAENMFEAAATIDEPVAFFLLAVEDPGWMFELEPTWPASCPADSI